MLPSYIPLNPHLPQNHYNIKKTGLLISNELGEKGGEKKGVTNLYLPQNHYKIEMAILAFLGVLVHIGEKVVTDCDIMGVDGRMGGGFVMMVAESLHCQKPGAELRATPAFETQETCPQAVLQ